MLDILTKIFKYCKYYEKDIIFTAVIILIAVISFGLGRLSKIRGNNVPLTVENLEAVNNNENTNLDQKQVLDKLNQKSFVASKNGKKYHYVWCDSASGIKDENKIFFATKEEAQDAGYEPAANCKGL